MFRVAISLLLTLSTVSAFAEEAPLVMSFANVPFKSCEGRGDSMAGLYADQKVTVIFSANSIQIVDAKGKKETYASAKKLCGIDLMYQAVSCRKQEDGLNAGGSAYLIQKECNIPIPGVPNRYSLYRLDLSLALNLMEIDGKKTAGGFLSCVANNDGFRGLELSNCK